MTLAIAAAGLFLAVVSTTVVSVALPTMGRDLGAGPSGLEWIVDAYVLVYASLLIPGGVIADRYGRKGIFLIGVALFGFGALLAGLAPTLDFLLVARIVQGLGPALLVPGSLTLIRATFTHTRQRAVAVGLWSTASGLALAVGPVLGGFLIQAAGWRWVFLLNVPLSAILLLAGARWVPRFPGEPGRRFDLVGALASVAGVALLAAAVIEGPTRGWNSASVLAAFALGLAALVGFARWERRDREPLIDVALFARTGFTVATVAAAVVFFAFVGAIVYFSTYFQQVQGASGLKAGWDVSAIGIAYAVTATLSGRLVGRIGERLPLVVGLVVSGVAMLGLLRLQPDTGMSAIWWNFAALGAGIGLCGTPMTTIAMSAVDTAQAGMASAVVNSARQIGQVFGVAVLGAVIYAGGDSYVTGLHRAVLVSGCALLATALLSAVLLLAPARPSAARRAG